MKKRWKNYLSLSSLFIFWKFEKAKMSYLLEKTLVLSIISSKCRNKDQKTFKEQESIEIWKILGLIGNI